MEIEKLNENIKQAAHPTLQNIPENTEVQVDVIFNRCLEGDKSEVWTLFVDSMKAHVEKVWEWDEAWQFENFESSYVELNTSFVIFNGQRVGYVQYTLSEQDTYVHMIILYPQNRSLGYGVPILKKLESLQTDKPLQLRCFKYNEKAYQFYMQNNFEKVDDEEFFYLLRWPRV